MLVAMYGQGVSWNYLRLSFPHPHIDGVGLSHPDLFLHLNGAMMSTATWPNGIWPASIVLAIGVFLSGLHLMSYYGILVSVPPKRTLSMRVLHQTREVVFVHIGRAVIVFVFFILHVLSRINVYTLFASILNVLHKHDTKA